MNESLSCSIKSDPIKNEIANNTQVLLLSLSFLSGSLVAAYFFRLSQIPNFFLDIVFNDDFSEEYSVLKFLRFSRFHFLILFLGPSLFGLINVPCLFFLRGCCFSLTAVSLISFFGEKGLIAAIIIMSLDVLVSIPIFYLFGIDALKLSEKIACGVFGRRFSPDNKLIKHFLYVLPLLLIASFFENYILRIILFRFR